MSDGETSGSKYTSDEIWAKLVPSDPKCHDIEIRSNETVISSEISCSSQEKHVWCKITRNSDKRSAIVKNTSSNPMLVDETVLQGGDEALINCGSEIVSGPDKEGYLSYRFKVMPRQEANEQKLKICINAEHAKCSICLNVWHDVVSVAPCLHNFCNGCFSEWLRRSQEKGSTVLCPQCRAAVQYVGRNHFLHSIEEDILRSDASLRRTDEELALLDSYASIKSNLVVHRGKKNQRKRSRSMAGEEWDSFEPACPQCAAEFRGFRCNRSTIHLQCQACGGMMPSGADAMISQYCLGCDRAFCGAYWHAQGLSNSDSHFVCRQETFKPISERSISQIPYVVHEKNRHEQHITERCIGKMGRSLQDIIREWIQKLDNHEIDRTRMPLNHAETITARTHVCNNCYDKLVSFLLYWFRISLPKSLLPPDAANREDCWYGYACRTQHHNEEHARRRNHVCRPTRGAST